MTDPWVEGGARALDRHGCRLLKGYRTARRAVVTPFLGANRRNGASGRGQLRNARRSAPRSRLGTDRAQIAGVGPLLIVDVTRKGPNGLTHATSMASMLARSAFQSHRRDATAARPDSGPTDRAGQPDIENHSDQIAV